MIIVFFFQKISSFHKKKKLSQKKNNYHFSLFLLKKLPFQIFQKWKNAKSLSTRHTFVAILSKIFFFESLNFAKKNYQLDKSLWNWFSNTPGREPKSWYESKFLCEKPKTACTRSHQCEKFSVSKLSFNLRLVNGSHVKKFLEHKKINLRSAISAA